MRVIVLLGLIGCGRYGFEESNSLGLDASVSRTDCWSAWTNGPLVVGEPRAITEIANAVNPSISGDGLTLYFERGQDLYSASRQARDVGWGEQALLETLKTDTREGRFSTNADGTFGVFTSARGGNQDLWTTQRSSKEAAFGAPSQELVLNLKSTKSELDPELSPDGLHLYYAPFGSGSQEIRVATRTKPENAFTMTRILDELQISSAVADPALSPDETVIVFSSGATGAQNDLYYATRANRDARFGTPKQVPAVNRTPNINDGDVDISSDGCDLYFVSDRSGASQIYLARVTPSM